MNQGEGVKGDEDRTAEGGRGKVGHHKQIARAVASTSLCVCAHNSSWDAIVVPEELV